MGLNKSAAPCSMSVWDAETEWYGINKLYFFSKHHEYIFLTSFMIFDFFQRKMKISSLIQVEQITEIVMEISLLD